MNSILLKGYLYLQYKYTQQLTLTNCCAAIAGQQNRFTAIIPIHKKSDVCWMSVSDA